MGQHPSMQIDGRSIGADDPPWIIAELSANHNGSLERALAIVVAAAEAGAHPLKLQTYTADTMTLDLDEGEFRIDDIDSPWHGYSLYRLYEEAHTPWEWHEPIFRRCRKLGLTPFSSVFDPSSIEFLESLDVPAYKISSFEITDLPLIRLAANTGKPLIISTGMGELEQIDQAISAARDAGCRDLLLLKCTGAYPAGPRASNLRTISDMQGRFGCPIGVSDHTPGIGAAAAAVAYGAVAIEKHVTLSRAGRTEIVGCRDGTSMASRR